MAEERDSILRIRAKIDSCDEWEEAQDAKPVVSDDHSESRVSLCAPQKPVRVWNVSNALATQEFGLANFVNRLAKFLHLYGGLNVSIKRLETCSVRHNFCCWQTKLIHPFRYVATTPCESITYA
jgi:hypothetical protein